MQGVLPDPQVLCGVLAVGPVPRVPSAFGPVPRVPSAVGPVPWGPGGHPQLWSQSQLPYFCLHLPSPPSSRSHGLVLAPALGRSGMDRSKGCEVKILGITGFQHPHCKKCSSVTGSRSSVATTLVGLVQCLPEKHCFIRSKQRCIWSLNPSSFSLQCFWLVKEDKPEDPCALPCKRLNYDNPISQVCWGLILHY